MKKVVTMALLCMAAVSSKAALFITNNTACPISMSIRGHDANHTGQCTLQSVQVTVGAGGSLAYNNVASLNTSPGWQGGLMAVTTGGPTVWGWDAIKYFAVSGGVFGGGLGSGCSSPTSVTFPSACGGATVTGTWTTVGSNTFIDFN
ncbi:hypothetical protein [Taibaiella koreensis]|uniref:hypothetical protein n=1 Tax=Taibaiella koreensis TaxID=1268548 RepID=UPI000E59F848|nr:hypothetical protein [Taibaiella koreensis]